MLLKNTATGVLVSTSTEAAGKALVASGSFVEVEQPKKRAPRKKKTEQ